MAAELEFRLQLLAEREEVGEAGRGGGSVRLLTLICSTASFFLINPPPTLPWNCFAKQLPADPNCVSELLWKI